MTQAIACPKTLLPFLLLVSQLLTGCSVQVVPDTAAPVNPPETAVTTDSPIPPFAGQPYVVLNDNQPSFPEKDLQPVSFETYAELDSLGRCGPAYASVSLDTMPTEDRGSISSVKPTGWHSVKYDCVEGKSLYNRCHLIGFQLTGENANKENLITGSRYLNVTGMLPFEDLVADYVHETGNHVLYRVTPVFYEDELVARGVQMEGYSVEDQGDGICFNVYAYNNQPGVLIDYATGESRLDDGTTTDTTVTLPDSSAQDTQSTQEFTYILNTNTKKFHLPDCSSAASTKEENKEIYTGTRQSLIDQGYTPCGQCKP